MTSKEYAAKVADLVRQARDHGGTFTMAEQTAAAYAALAAGAASRCEGIGQEQYEVEPGTQKFEMHDAAWAVAEARQEVLDIPAYLAQVAHLGSLDGDEELLRGVHLAARLLMVLDRLDARLAGAA